MLCRLMGLCILRNIGLRLRLLKSKSIRSLTNESPWLIRLLLLYCYYRNDISPHHRKMMYYGYAFESYCTTDTPRPTDNSRSQDVLSNHPPGWGGDVDTNIQWCSVVRTKLGDIKLIIGGEVDCVEGEFVRLPVFLMVKSARDSMVGREMDA